MQQIISYSTFPRDTRLLHADVALSALQPVIEGGNLIKGGDVDRGFWGTPIFIFIPLIRKFNQIKNIIRKYITLWA
jgi:hypothetical protein